MLKSLLPLLATALSLLVVDIIFPGVNLATFTAALVGAAAIGMVNWGVKPVVKVLSLPITIVTLGGFSLIVNGLCFWLASIVVPGFQVSGLLSFILGPVILSFVNTLLTNYLVEKYPEAGQIESSDSV
ncbi:MAG: phage holin family protein [Cyanobacteria bacterium J06592_8]